MGVWGAGREEGRCTDERVVVSCAGTWRRCSDWKRAGSAGATPTTTRSSVHRPTQSTSPEPRTPHRDHGHRTRCPQSPLSDPPPRPPPNPNPRPPPDLPADPRPAPTPHQPHQHPHIRQAGDGARLLAVWVVAVCACWSEDGPRSGDLGQPVVWLVWCRSTGRVGQALPGPAGFTRECLPRPPPPNRHILSTCTPATRAPPAKPHPRPPPTSPTQPAAEPHLSG